jgi:hypothetical protein
MPQSFMPAPAFKNDVWGLGTGEEQRGRASEMSDCRG